jgi:predicted nucleic acid-binding protein
MKLMSDDHVFIDTNILVYAHDKDAGEKHILAARKILSLYDRPYPPALSTQVLQELYVNLTRKKVSAKDASGVVEMYSEFEVISHDVTLIRHGIEIHERYKISFWDSMIVAAAQVARATVLWSEDLQEGQDFDGVVVRNPLIR